MANPRVPELAQRISEYEEAIGTFARLHEELTELRDNVTVPEAGARIDRMLQLNAETLAAIKHSLALAKTTLQRLSGTSPAMPSLSAQ